MKALLVCEYRDGKLMESSYELFGFAERLGAETALVLVGDSVQLPRYGGKLYLAAALRVGEYNPDLHKEIILRAAEVEGAECIVFLHSSYGWDLAPRVATRMKAGLVSEVVGITANGFEVCCCNAKLRREVRPATPRSVVTIQAGAFPATESLPGTPSVEWVEFFGAAKVEFLGYEPAEKREVDLAKAEVIVSAGRGVGKKENVPVIAALARALGGELGASRPVVDAGWLDHGHQVGTTGQTVSPKVYVACGISGAIQHLAGMKKSEFVVAVNKDKDAPIAEVADVLVVADVLPFAEALTARLQE